MKTKKGISLIVLVITIIVMLVLASAVIITLSNSNIITKAKDAVNKTNEATLKSVANVAWSEGYLQGNRGEQLKEYVLNKLAEDNLSSEKHFIIITDTGVEFVPKTEGWQVVQDESGVYSQVKRGDEVLNIGDDFFYEDGLSEDNVNYGTTYKVLGASDEGELLILADGPYDDVTFEGGLENYKNIISILDSYCKQYANGKNVVKARNIRMADVNKVLGYNPLNEGVYDPLQLGVGVLSHKDDQYEYKATYTYYWIGEDTVYYEVSNGLTGTKTGVEKFYYFNGKDFEISEAPEGASETNKIKIATLTNGVYSYNPDYLSSSNLNGNIKENRKLRSLFAVGSDYFLADKIFLNGRYYVPTFFSSGGVISFYSFCSVISEELATGGGTQASGKVQQTYPRAVIHLKRDISVTGSTNDGWTME